MPIDLNVLSSPEPGDTAPSGSEAAASEEARAPKRRRRKKEEMIADAVVPADDEKVEIKDLASGAKVLRFWAQREGILPSAVEAVEAGSAEWPTSDLKYAHLKYQQAQAAAAALSDTGEDPAHPELDRSERAFETPGGGDAPAGASLAAPEASAESPLPTDASGMMIAPEGAEHGDEVVVGATVYVVGPSGKLVKGAVDVPAKRRWQRELGDPQGPWHSQEIVRLKPVPDPALTGSGNGAGQITTQTERLPREIEQIDLFTWQIGTGVMEKIGLPDYSQLQIGPIHVSRKVIDDGRRTRVSLHGDREDEVPTAIVEGFETADNVVEFIAGRFRGQLQNFLEATGALKQPVS
jgi:hypothetical protein